MMKQFFSISIFFFCVTVGGCKKSGSSVLDLSDQWQLDFNGNIIRGVSNPNDVQWQNQPFTSTELALFESLDTADLTGTSQPTSVQSSYLYPNPFTSQALISFRFNDDYTGQLKLKYVIADKNMSPVQKGTSLLSVNQTFFHLFPNFSSANYRMYITLSSQSNENFYTSWGNIQHTQ